MVRAAFFSLLSLKLTSIADVRQRIHLCRFDEFWNVPSKFSRWDMMLRPASLLCWYSLEKWIFFCNFSHTNGMSIGMLIGWFCISSGCYGSKPSHLQLLSGTLRWAPVDRRPGNQLVLTEFFLASIHGRAFETRAYRWSLSQEANYHWLIISLLNFRVFSKRGPQTWLCSGRHSCSQPNSSPQRHRRAWSRSRRRKKRLAERRTCGSASAARGRWHPQSCKALLISL